MSHFSVLVLTQQEPTEEILELILGEYDEQKRVKPYLYKTKKQIMEEKMAYIESLARADESLLSLEEQEIFNTKDMRKAYQLSVKDYINSGYIVNKKGDICSTYNQNAKFDYYLINQLPFNKENTKTCLVKDICFEPNKSQQDKIISKCKQDWESIQTLHMLYNNNFTDYVNSFLFFYTWAIVLPDGTWIEPGQVGWFGTSSASIEDAVKWCKNYQEFLKDYQNCYATLLDCHI